MEPKTCASLLVDDFNWLKTHGEAGRIKSGGDCCGINERQSADQNSDRPVELNRPAEGLLIDDEDENEREQDAKGQSCQVGHQPKQAGFDKNQAANLPCRAPQETQQSELAATVDDERKQRTDDTHHSDKDGDGLKRVGDGKGAVKDADGLGPQGSVGENEDLASGTGTAYGLADGVE